MGATLIQVDDIDIFLGCEYKQTILICKEVCSAMKKTAFLISLVFLFVLVFSAPFARSQEASKLGPKYGGKTFRSSSDPGYLSYEREIKVILLEKIEIQYGVELNGDILSSDQLLEIEALLRLKSRKESVEHILSRFPEVILRAPSS